MGVEKQATARRAAEAAAGIRSGKCKGEQNIGAVLSFGAGEIKTLWASDHRGAAGVGQGKSWIRKGIGKSKKFVDLGVSDSTY
jgi:hypothetical protein